MRAPWMPDRSYAACGGRWDRAVNNARENLGDLPRYREVSYEGLRADPGAGCRGLFEWLGVGTDDQVLETVRVLSQEQYSDLGVVAPRSISGRLMRRARDVVKSQRDRVWALGRYQEPGSEMVLRFVSSLRKRDAETLRSLTASSFEFVYRSADGDLSVGGEEVVMPS